MSSQPFQQLSNSQIETVADLVVSMSVHYAVWTELTAIESGDHYRVTLPRFRNLIQASKLAHFNAFCSLTTKLCQRDRDVVGMDDVIATMRTVDGKVADEILDVRERMYPIVHRIRRARTRLFDHQELSETSRDSLNWINIDQVDLTAFVQSAQLAMSKILDSMGIQTSDEFFENVELSEMRATEEVRKVFDELSVKRG